jgi:carboxyl-terminal processing protease
MNKLFLSLLLIININLFAKENQKDQNKEKVPTKLESLSKLHTVLYQIEYAYVSDLKFHEIVDKAIAGVMSELDAHSSYLNQKSYKTMNTHMKGEFGGLGIVIGMKKGALTVVSPIDDTPAQKAGIQAKDIILKIENKSTLKMTLDEAVSIMRGKPGTPIEITIVREGETKPLKINIVRGVIKVKSVKAKTIGDDILYLRISSFDNNVDKQLIKYIKKYAKNTKGIVLDLRNNPGGSLGQSIKTVDLFVDKGIIVSQKGKTKNDEQSYKASSYATLTKVPIVVLVNGGSASASEIVSGALQDSKRAIIIGETTFGKGSVQAVIPITKDRSEAIKLTIAKYYLPSGRTIQAKGIVPDIISYAGKVPGKDEDDFSIKEKDLKKHLEVELEKTKSKDDIKKEKELQNNKEDKTVLTNETIQSDNQLKTGIDVLRALILTNK